MTSRAPGCQTGRPQGCNRFARVIRGGAGAGTG